MKGAFLLEGHSPLPELRHICQPVVLWLSYVTWTRKVGDSIPGAAMIRSAQLWALEQGP